MFRRAWVLLILAISMALGGVSLHAEKKEETAAASALTLRNYGHAFIYLITSTGVRIAIDPYAESSALTYKFPVQLPADVVLISNETLDHDGSIRLSGSPQIFSSVTAIGLNNARGLLFRGVPTFPSRNDEVHGITNAAFTFTLDGIHFCHLGAIGHPLTPTQRAQIGSVDVLFLPVGTPNLNPAELAKIVEDTGARIIIPIAYRTKYSADMKLRSLQEFFAGLPSKPLVKDLKGSAELSLKPADLPEKPTYYLLPVVQMVDEDDAQ
ncbi:MAG: MBL fold metallo-hydrolase [Verrucomicrobium sp.]|nr:MBL fold metallo-hydrolase [Verrucomicrobium sp.]